MPRVERTYQTSRPDRLHGQLFSRRDGPLELEEDVPGGGVRLVTAWGGQRTPHG